MDHSLVNRILTSFYKGRQVDIKHFHRNPLQAHLQVIAILTQVIAIIEKTDRVTTIEVPTIQAIRKLLVQDAILRFGRPALLLGIHNTENRPPTGNIYRPEPLTEALIDEVSSVSSDSD